MLGASDKLIVAVVHPEVPINANINQTVITTPPIGMDDAVGVDFASNNGLQRGFGSIGHDFCVNAVTSLEQTEHNGFAACAAPSFASNSLGAKVGLIGLKLVLKWRLSAAVLRHAQTNALIDGVGASDRQASEFSRICSRQIHGKKANKLPELGFADFRTVIVPIFCNYFKKLACGEHMFAS